MLQTENNNYRTVRHLLLFSCYHFEYCFVICSLLKNENHDGEHYEFSSRANRLSIFVGFPLLTIPALLRYYHDYCDTTIIKTKSNENAEFICPRTNYIMFLVAVSN